MISLLHRNDNFVTVHNKCSKIPPWTSVHFATSVPRSRVVRLSWSSRLFMRAAAFKMRAIRLVYPLFFCKFALHPAPQTARLKPFYLGNHSELDTCLYDLFFITMTDTIPSQNMNVSSWITLYKLSYYCTILVSFRLRWLLKIWKVTNPKVFYTPSRIYWIR